MKIQKALKILGYGSIIEGIISSVILFITSEHYVFPFRLLFFPLWQALYAWQYQNFFRKKKTGN